MNIPFPAVIKDIRIGADGILATLDISPPDLSMLADLIDREVTVTISVEQLFTDMAPASGPAAPLDAAHGSAVEKLPFEPDDDDERTMPSTPRRRKGGAASRKRAE